MNDDIPWAYVAMIFIAFVSWVYGRLKEAAEIRRARAATKRAAQEARNRAQPAPPPSPYRSPTPTSVPERAPTSPEIPVPAPVPAAGIETPKTFRELFEMLQEQAAPAPIEEPRPYAPPPLPVPVAPVQSEVDRIFYGPGKAEKVAAPLRVERVRGKTSSNLNRILKNRGTLREALILKEILDTPVAMKE
ncbi:MAG: hypothetical protein NWR21_02845 [Verrucomicrobiales bacterium]|jgi:hypothetical protein|nr:hypothetical protein [Verrucomicrobiales bacterium]MDP4792030.1 hypothetical protein [Verrucomicrobiales bacterium]MDP4938231.1 hypothetical protein [Verrucomicrobiales bacterium]MDP5004596.1 hypothetical protein [Verrucomicrobiales bacterium]